MKARIASNPIELQYNIHGPFFPLDIRPGEGIQAFFSSPKVVEKSEVQVWRLSPLGLEIAVNRKSFELGDVVDISLNLGGQICEYHGLTVSSKHTQMDRAIVGIRFCDEEPRSNTNVDRRLSRRWVCGQNFLPSGVAPNPLRYSDFIFFRILDISKEGMRVVTSLRNKSIVPKMRLNATLILPMIGQTTVAMQVMWTNFLNGSPDGLVLGVRIVDPTYDQRLMFGQYLLQFSSGCTAEQLRDSGFVIHNIATAVSFGFVRTEDEYREVLALRKLAYVRASKAHSDQAVEEFGDIFDTRSRILIAKHQNRIVASMRLIFHEPGDTLEQEQYINLPEDFYRKDELVEVTRVCTDPGYRRGDLLLGLMRYMALAIIQANRRYMIGCATDDLLSFYVRMGCRPTRLSYQHKDLGGQKHTLFVADLHQTAAGIGVNPIIWNIAYSELVGYLLENRLLRFDFHANLRLFYCRLFRGIARWAFKRKMKSIRGEEAKRVSVGP